MSKLYKVAQARNIKLYSHFIRAWKDSSLFPKEAKHLTNTQLQQAFSSPQTTDEIRNAILNSIFNPYINYAVQLGVKTLRIEPITDKRGKVFLSWFHNRNEVWFPTTSEHRQILQSSYVRYPLTGMVSSISKLLTPQQMSKGLNASAWISGYLGLLSNFAFLVRGFTRHNDIGRILWAYPPTEEEQALWESEIKDDTFIWHDKQVLGKGLQKILDDLNKYDSFINSLGIEGGITSKHNQLKDELTRLITICNSQEMLDLGLINQYRRDEYMDGKKEKGGLESFGAEYNLIFSALSVVDTSREVAEAMTNIDFGDHDIMDKIMGIHGNKLPPPHYSSSIFNAPSTHLKGADEYFRERDAWRRNNILKPTDMA